MTRHNQSIRRNTQVAASTKKAPHASSSPSSTTKKPKLSQNKRIAQLTAPKSPSPKKTKETTAPRAEEPDARLSDDVGNVGTEEHLPKRKHAPTIYRSQLRIRRLQKATRRRNMLCKQTFLEYVKSQMQQITEDVLKPIGLNIKSSLHASKSGTIALQKVLEHACVALASDAYAIAANSKRYSTKPSDVALAAVAVLRRIPVLHVRTSAFGPYATEQSAAPGQPLQPQHE